MNDPIRLTGSTTCIQKARSQPSLLVRWHSSALAMALFSLALGQTVLASGCSPAQEDASDKIAALIEQLESKDFVEREQATEQLGKFGEQAIKPLAYRTLACNSESKWRIKHILEQIGISGNEEEFYLCTRILQTRFGVGNSANQQRLSELKTKWKLQRKKKAIAKLSDLGATIVNPNANQQDLNAAALNAFFLNQRIRTNVLPVSGTMPTAQKSTIKKRANKQEIKSSLDEIFETDIETNRRLAFGEEPKSPKNQPWQSPIQNRGGVQILPNGIVVQNAGWNPSTGIRVSLNPRWKGNDEDLKILNELDHVSELSFSNQTISKSTMELIAGLSISQLVFDDCTLEVDDWDNDWPKQLSLLRFSKQKITGELTAELNNVKSIGQINFDRCKFEDKAFDELAKVKGIGGMQLEGLDLDAKMFDQLAKLKNIKFFNLVGVRFLPKDYRKFELERPGIQMNYTAKALLGVRGPTSGISEAGCEISDVVVNSGAEAAGMKVGDVIEEIDGEKIIRFEDLRLHVAGHLPGDTLKIVVRRGKERVDLKVQLKDASGVN